MAVDGQYSDSTPSGYHLRAPVQHQDGTLEQPTRGTPQGVRTIQGLRNSFSQVVASSTGRRNISRFNKWRQWLAGVF